MKFVHKQFAHTQDVDEGETVRIALLKQAGWTEAAETKAAEVKPTETPKVSTSETPKTGSLPDDFPGVVALRAAGLGTFGALLAVPETTLTDVAGIGKTTAKQIHAALNAD